MGIPYRRINCKPFILFLMLGFVFLATCPQAQAYNDFFTVVGITVDVTAANAVTARDEAFAKAQVDAFNVLAKRMAGEGQTVAVATPDMATISTMIQDFEVTNEQLSDVRYIGTYTFRFRESAVTQFFSLKGVQYTTETKPTLLVLPFFQDKGHISLWGDNNQWLRSWGRADLKFGAVPVVVPIGDLDDVADLDDSRALSYDRGGLSKMMGRYGAVDAALMIAVPDEQLAAGAPDAVALGTLRISFYSTDGLQPLYLQDLNFAADGKKTLSALYDEAVQAAYGALQRDWKTAAPVASFGNAQNYSVRAEFAGIAEWMKMQNALRGVMGVTDISVKGLRPNGARLTFGFPGDENRLRQVLAQSGLDLSEAVVDGGSVSYTLRYSGIQETDGFYVAPEGSAQQPTTGGGEIPQPVPEEPLVHTF